MNLFKYLFAATDAAKKNLKADLQIRLAKRELEGKIDSLETKQLTLESDLQTARQALATADGAESMKSKVQKILDIKLDQEAAVKGQALLEEELSTLFNEGFVPPTDEFAAAPATK